eukprot:TRINITY_DN31857_c0_g1_i1.p1 TRINITY_DN31857_c0_g1~~TRINITY_DN31857_c0_g1_i1.p1  ORF type:complete len:249 (+),score=48.15 TRINITY_DN31857_c0_g1_i1:46-747(+)
MRGTQKWVASINEVMRKSPSNCMFYMFLARTGIFSTASMASGAVGLPVELALAFAVTRPIKKIRLPLDMLGAVGLAKVFPFLKTIEVSRLLSGGVGTTPESAEKFWARYPKLAEYWEKSTAFVNSYGAAYFLARDMIGLALCLLFTYLLVHDPFTITDSLMYYSGVSASTAHTFSAMAGGACVSSFSSPFLLVSLPSAVRKISEYIDIDKEVAKYQQKLEQQIANQEQGGKKS